MVYSKSSFKTSISNIDLIFKLPCICRHSFFHKFEFIHGFSVLLIFRNSNNKFLSLLSKPIDNFLKFPFLKFDSNFLAQFQNGINLLLSLSKFSLLELLEISKCRVIAQTIGKPTAHFICVDFTSLLGILHSLF